MCQATCLPGSPKLNAPAGEQVAGGYGLQEVLSLTPQGGLPDPSKLTLPSGPWSERLFLQQQLGSLCTLRDAAMPTSALGPF